MPALEFLAHFLEVISSPLVIGVIVLVSCLSGSRNTVRAGAIAVGAILGLFAIERLEAFWSRGLDVALGMTAGALAAEIWISLVLPVGFALSAAAAALHRSLKRATKP